MNCIVFDKTGTLTIGKPLVVNTRLFKNMVLKELFELVAAAEVCSIAGVRITQGVLCTIISKTIYAYHSRIFFVTSILIS